MSAYQWAKETLQAELEAGRSKGLDDLMMLRALLSSVVEASKAHRSAADLAAELTFLADNLDDDREYAFMRP